MGDEGVAALGDDGRRRTGGDTRHPVRGLAAAVSWILVSGFRSAPGLSLVAFGLTALLVASPAINVLATSSLLSVLARRHDAEAVVPPLVLLVASVALFGPVTSAVGSVKNRLNITLRGRLQARFGLQISRTPLAELATDDAASAIARVDTAIGMNVVWQYQYLLELMQFTLASIGVVVTVWVIEWVAGALIALALVPVLVASVLVSRHTERVWDRVAPAFARERYAREQIVRQRSAMELASLGTAERFSGMITRYWSSIAAELGTMMRPQIIGGVASGIATAAILAGALVAVIVGSRQGAAAGAGVVGVLSALAAVSAVGGTAGAIVENAPVANVVRRFLERDLPPREHCIHGAVGALEVQGATYSYPGASRPAIDAVDLSIRRGEMVALVGRNGAGKTTLINALIGLLALEHGRVLADGVDLASLPEPERLGYFGVLTQEFSRFELTVRDAVGLGAPAGRAADDSELWDALTRAHADDVVRIAGGLDAQLGQQFGGVGLSGGQWQRLALARIHLRDAPIWVLDEPTSSIDGESEALIFRELARSRAGRLTVIVSHRAWTLKDMDRILVIDGGRLVESGTFAELLAAEGTFSELFREQLVSDAS